MGQKGLQKPFISVRFDRFRGNHQQPERAKIASLQTLLRKPPGAQAIVVSEIRRRRGAGPISLDRVKPKDRSLNEIRGSEAVGRAACERGIKVAPNESHIVILRKPGYDYRRGMVDHERAVVQYVF